MNSRENLNRYRLSPGKISWRLSLILLCVLFVLTAIGNRHGNVTLAAGERLLGYIPYDTAFLFGTTHGIRPGVRFAAWRNLLQPIALQGSSLIPARIARQGGHGMGIAAALVRQLAAATANEEEWPFHVIGMPRSGVIAAYTVAGVPVLRWQLQEPQILHNTLRKAERMAHAHGRIYERDGLQQWRYPFGETGDGPLDLVIAAGDGFALVTLDSPGIDDDTANRVLGITKPQTVFNPVRLDDIATAHGLIPGTVGIIDNQRLLDALSGIQGGYLGQIIDDFAGLYGASENVLSGFHAPGCYSKAALVTDLWPGTALGIPVTDQTGGSVNLRLIGEISYTDTLVSLERLRSPAARTVSEPGSILSIGVGLDLPALRRLVDHLEQGVATTSTFSCPGLVSVVERLTNFISAWRESFGGGSDGEQEIDDTELEYIKGLTASIYPIKPSADSPAISGKAVVTLTAEHPEITRQMLYRVLGFDTNAKTGSGGETVSLSRDGMPGLSNVRAMLRENELILLTGDAKFPEEEGTTQTASPGLFALHYQGEGLSRAMELTGRQLTRPAQSKQRATLLAMAKHLRNTGFDLELRADVVETGINLDLTAPVPE